MSPSSHSANSDGGAITWPPRKKFSKAPKMSDETNQDRASAQTQDGSNQADHTCVNQFKELHAGENGRVLDEASMLPSRLASWAHVAASPSTTQMAQQRFSTITRTPSLSLHHAEQAPISAGNSKFLESCIQSGLKQKPEFLKVTRPLTVPGQHDSPSPSHNRSARHQLPKEGGFFQESFTVAQQPSQFAVPFNGQNQLSRPMRTMFSPMNAVQGPQLPAGERDLSYQEQVVARQKGISSTYGGSILNPNNWSKNIPDEQNASVWITGLPAKTDHHTLLTALLGVAPIGKVFACVVNAPEPRKGHQDAAAKIVFFNHEAASKLVATNIFLCNGATCRVSWNRIKAAGIPDEDRDAIGYQHAIAEEAFAKYSASVGVHELANDSNIQYVRQCMDRDGITEKSFTKHPYDLLPRPPTQDVISRVVVIIGPAETCCANFLTQYFSGRFRYQLDDVKTHWVRHFQGQDKTLACMEWRFGSYRCQAQSAMKILRLDLSGTMKGWWGVDPLETGTDSWTDEEMMMREVEAAMGCGMKLPPAASGESGACSITEEPTTRPPTASHQADLHQPKFCAFHGHKLPCHVCADASTARPASTSGSDELVPGGHMHSQFGSRTSLSSTAIPPHNGNDVAAAGAPTMSRLARSTNYPSVGEAGQRFPGPSLGQSGWYDFGAFSWPQHEARSATTSSDPEKTPTIRNKWPTGLDLDKTPTNGKWANLPGQAKGSSGSLGMWPSFPEPMHHHHYPPPSLAEEGPAARNSWAVQPAEHLPGRPSTTLPYTNWVHGLIAAAGSPTKTTSTTSSAVEGKWQKQTTGHDPGNGSGNGIGRGRWARRESPTAVAVVSSSRRILDSGSPPFMTATWVRQQQAQEDRRERSRRSRGGGGNGCDAGHEQQQQQQEDEKEEGKGLGEWNCSPARRFYGVKE